MVFTVPKEQGACHITPATGGTPGLGQEAETAAGESLTHSFYASCGTGGEAGRSPWCKASGLNSF